MADFTPTSDSQRLILEFVQSILAEHKSNQAEYCTKMEAIDRAYALYQSNVDPETGIVTGQGVDAATQPVGVLNLPTSTPPLVISQVDSMVGYLSDVFLSGTPLFPMVSSPKTAELAEQFESLVDYHSRIGGYARQILMFFRDGVKYNLSAIECPWTDMEQYLSMDNLLEPGKRKLKKDKRSFTALRRLDPYNTIWDRTVSPGDIAAQGDYAGEVRLLTRPKFKKLLNALSTSDEIINAKEALNLNHVGADTASAYRMHPQISDYVTSKKPESTINWYTYITGQPEEQSLGNNYEVIKLYLRIIPADFRMAVPNRNTPQIWEVLVVNQKVIVKLKRIISAFDYLPILFGQPLEDGLGYQTKSLAEFNIPFQTAAETLFNIRFNSARRAVSDRALYDPKVVPSRLVNAPIPAPKIPINSANRDPSVPLTAYYAQIPFDSRGTETALQDGLAIVNFSKDLSGLNNPMQGKFQKGNKSVREWEDTMSGADARLRLPALTLEYQVFLPMKEIIKLNLFQYGTNTDVTSHKTGQTISVDIDALRNAMLTFQVADGFTPKSKLASTETIRELLMMITQAPLLMQMFGPMVPGMFVHLVQLLGVKDFKQYAPDQNQVQSNVASLSQAQATPDMINQLMNMIGQQNAARSNVPS